MDIDNIFWWFEKKRLPDKNDQTALELNNFTE